MIYVGITKAWYMIYIAFIYNVPMYICIIYYLEKQTECK